MEINEYLEFRFGCVVDKKYNRWILEEIVSNPSTYPLLNDYLDTMHEALENKKYSLWCCECDDPEFELNAKQGQQLLCACLVAFAKRNKNKEFELVSVSCGEKFMPHKSLAPVTDQLGMICKGHEYFYLLQDRAYREYSLHDQDNFHTTKNTDAYIYNCKPLLNNINKTLFSSLKDSILNRFDENDLQEDDLGNYRVLFYEFDLKGAKEFARLTFYTTEGGFDPFYWIYLDTKNAYTSKLEEKKI